MNTVDRAMVRHVAGLARLRLPDAVEVRMTAELGRILEHVAVLERLPVRPAAGVAESTPLREDVVAASSLQADLLAGAPERDGDSFAVPAVLDVPE